MMLFLRLTNLMCSCEKQLIWMSRVTPDNARAFSFLGFPFALSLSKDCLFMVR